MTRDRSRKEDGIEKKIEQKLRDKYIHKWNKKLYDLVIFDGKNFFLIGIL